MDELIRQVSEKAGIGADQARQAVTAVLDFFKDKVPLVGDQLKGLLGGGGGGGGNLLGGLADKLGGMIGR